MVEVYVIAKKVGKDLNATYRRAIVELQTVLDTDSAFEVLVDAKLVGKVKHVKSLIAKILLVPIMVLAYKVNAIVKLAGKAIDATL